MKKFTVRQLEYAKKLKTANAKVAEIDSERDVLLGKSLRCSDQSDLTDLLPLSTEYNMSGPWQVYVQHFHLYHSSPFSAPRSSHGRPTGFGNHRFDHGHKNTALLLSNSK